MPESAPRVRARVAAILACIAVVAAQPTTMRRGHEDGDLVSRRFRERALRSTGAPRAAGPVRREGARSLATDDATNGAGDDDDDSASPFAALRAAAAASGGRLMTTYSRTPSFGTPPPRMREHNVVSVSRVEEVFDATAGELRNRTEVSFIAFGGHFMAEVFDTFPTVKYFPESGFASAYWTYLQIVTPGRPQGRFLHAMAVVGRDLFVFGGTDGRFAQGSFWRVRMNERFSAAEAFEIVAPRGGAWPEARVGPTLHALPNNRLLLFGGYNVKAESLWELWEYDIPRDRFLLRHRWTRHGFVSGERDAWERYEAVSNSTTVRTAQCEDPCSSWGPLGVVQANVWTARLASGEEAVFLYGGYADDWNSMSEELWILHIPSTPLSDEEDAELFLNGTVSPWMPSGGWRLEPVDPLRTPEEDRPSPRFAPMTPRVSDHEVLLLGGWNVEEAYYHPVEDWNYVFDSHHLVWRRSVEQSGEMPPLRDSTPTVVAPDGSSAWVMCGWSDEIVNDLYALNASTGEWMRIHDSVDPPAMRMGHTLERIGELAFLFGGRDVVNPDLIYNDLWTVAEDALWVPVSVTGTTPAARHNHACAVHGGTMWCYGGIGEGRKILGDLIAFTRPPPGRLARWVTHEPAVGADVPPPLYNHALVAFGNERLALFGGAGETDASNELWVFEGGDWTVATVDGPTGAEEATGADDDASAGDPASRPWVPSARYGHRMLPLDVRTLPPPRVVVENVAARLGLDVAGNASDAVLATSEAMRLLARLFDGSANLFVWGGADFSDFVLEDLWVASVYLSRSGVRPPLQQRDVLAFLATDAEEAGAVDAPGFDALWNATVSDEVDMADGNEGLSAWVRWSRVAIDEVEPEPDTYKRSAIALHSVASYGSVLLAVGGRFDWLESVRDRALRLDLVWTTDVQSLPMQPTRRTRRVRDRRSERTSASEPSSILQRVPVGRVQDPVKGDALLHRRPQLRAPTGTARSASERSTLPRSGSLEIRARSPGRLLATSDSAVSDVTHTLDDFLPVPLLVAVTREVVSPQERELPTQGYDAKLDWAPYRASHAMAGFRNKLLLVGGSRPVLPSAPYAAGVPIGSVQEAELSACPGSLQALHAPWLPHESHDPLAQYLLARFGAHWNDTCIPCPAGYRTVMDAEEVDEATGLSALHPRVRCEPCPAGRYSSVAGSDTCLPCPPGYFGFSAAAQSSWQCAPCPAGTFSNVSGADSCQTCKTSSFCPLASIVERPASARPTVAIGERQPVLLQPKSAVVNDIRSAFFWVGAGVLGGILLFVLIVQRRVKLRHVDLLDDHHIPGPNADELGIPVRQKTYLGGAVSLAVVGVGLLYTVLILIQFSIDNQRETQTLVPQILWNTRQRVGPVADMTLSLILHDVSPAMACTSDVNDLGTTSTSEWKPCNSLAVVTQKDLVVATESATNESAALTNQLVQWDAADPDDLGRISESGALRSRARTAQGTTECRVVVRSQQDLGAALAGAPFASGDGTNPGVVYIPDGNEGTRQCEMRWHCAGCTLMGSSAEVEFRLLQDHTFASMISWAIEGESSLPIQNSSIWGRLIAEDAYAFRGRSPSTVLFEATQSLFVDESTDEDDTGYHVSFLDSTRGSVSDLTSFSSTNGILVDFRFSRSSSSLQTRRYLESTPEALFGTISGAVLGILSIAGIFLKIIERVALFVGWYSVSPGVERILGRLITDDKKKRPGLDRQKSTAFYRDLQGIGETDDDGAASPSKRPGGAGPTNGEAFDVLDGGTTPALSLSSARINPPPATVHDTDGVLRTGPEMDTRTTAVHPIDASTRVHWA